jgi:hypothetical protein
LIFALGILAWPVRGGVKPADQRPNRRESLAIRQLTGGFWLHRKLNDNQNYDSNIAIRTGCTCEIGESPWSNVRTHFTDEKCPIHGDIKGADQANEY